MQHAEGPEPCKRGRIFVLMLFFPDPRQQAGQKGKARTHHGTIGHGTREMNRLHLVRKFADERIDGGAVEVRDAHAQDAQAREFGDESAHKLPRAATQIEPAQARTGAQELHDGDEEGQVVVVSDEREAECFEVGKERVGRRTRRARAGDREDVVRAKDSGGCCRLVERSVEGERDEVMRVRDAREDNVGDARVDEFEVCEVLYRLRAKRRVPRVRAWEIRAERQVSERVCVVVENPADFVHIGDAVVVLGTEGESRE